MDIGKLRRESTCRWRIEPIGAMRVPGILYADEALLRDMQRARKRQRDEMGTLGSGNHYLEVQHIAELYRPEIAQGFGLRTGEIVISIHCGSRGLGHQIGTDYLSEMVQSAPSYGIHLPDRELACAPKDVNAVVDLADRAGLACKIARLEPLICVKG
jgi:tRNA-splicing ligase RtcB (3'-phosphate/5'-hydroxy nucleic acid ligase)